MVLIVHALGAGTRACPSGLVLSCFGEGEASVLLQLQLRVERRCQCSTRGCMPWRFPHNDGVANQCSSQHTLPLYFSEVVHVRTTNCGSYVRTLDLDITLLLGFCSCVCYVCC